MKTKLLVIAFLVGAFMLACTDDEKIEIDTNTYRPSNNFDLPIALTQTESFANDIFATAFNFIKDSTLWHRSTFPKVVCHNDTIDINFGDADTTTLSEIGDIRYRSGRMQITFSQSWELENSVMKISVNNLKLSQMITMNGTAEIANRGKKLVSNLNKYCPTYDFAIVKADISVVGKTNGYYQYSTSKTYSQVSGDTTQTFFDDIFTISGRSNGSWSDSNYFSLETTKDYRYNGSCQWFNDGAATIYINSLERYVKFENVTCCPSAILFVGNDNNSELRIELP